MLKQFHERNEFGLFEHSKLKMWPSLGYLSEKMLSDLECSIGEFLFKSFSGMKLSCSLAALFLEQPL